MTRRLLIADDTEDIRVLLRLILQDFDIAAEAADGAEALAHWEQNRDQDVFALILDYRMPRLTGLDVARRVLADSPDQKVVLFSANFDDALRQEALDAGCAAVIDKDQLVGLASHPVLAA